MREDKLDRETAADEISKYLKYEKFGKHLG
jgi:hypothetical protein